MSRENQSPGTKIFILFLALFACGYFFITKKHQTLQSSTTKPTTPPAEVNVINVTKQKIRPYFELPARISAYKISEVRPQVEGIIKEIKFTEGSFVEQGQQLYQIDPTIYQASFNSAKENLRTLKVKKERFLRLLELDAASEQEVDEIRSALAQAEDNFNKAKTNLSYTKVLAPISGFISKSNVTVGALVTSNQAAILTTIAQLDPVYVDMAQPSKESYKLRNQTDPLVGLTIENDPTYQATEKLQLIDVFADENTDSIGLRAKFSNPDNKLIPGSLVNAKIFLDEIDAITIPQKATNRAPDGSLTVWVVDEQNLVTSRKIKAQETFGNSWIISAGLQDGEIIVLEGSQKISDGAKVNPAFVDQEDLEPTKPIEKK